MKRKKYKAKRNVMLDYYKSVFGYLGEIRGYLLFTIVLFFISVGIGVSFHSYLGFLDELLKDLVDNIKGLNGFEMFLYILQNNTQSALYSILLGIFLGIMPLFSTVTNGVVLGYVLIKASLIDGPGVILQILPHGIFELPAIFIAIALGISLGFLFIFNYFNYYLKKENNLMIILGIFLLPFAILFSMIADVKLWRIQIDSFRHKFYNSANVFFGVVLPLLIVAAIIETLLIFALG